MKKIELTKEQVENMSYTDVAYLILKEKGDKMSIQDIFTDVIDLMELPESYFESKIGDFFRLLSTDKRFIMLEKGYWDLKDNHVNKVIIDEDDEEEVVIDTDESMSDEDESVEVNYDDDTVEDDDEDDDLKDLVIVAEEDMEDM